MLLSRSVRRQSVLNLSSADLERLEQELAECIPVGIRGESMGCTLQSRGNCWETLAILVDEYDRAHNRQPEKPSPLAVLHLLMEEHDLSGRDLGRILGNQAAGGFILRGERSITVEQAKKLGERFSVDPVVFLGL